MTDIQFTCTGGLYSVGALRAWAMPASLCYGSVAINASRHLLPVCRVSRNNLIDGKSDRDDVFVFVLLRVGNYVLIEICG